MPDDRDDEDYTQSTEDDGDMSEDDRTNGIINAEQSLLNGSATKHNRNGSDVSSTMNSRGRLRAYWLGIVVCMGGFLFGYDSGIIGGVLILSSYQHDYRYGEDQATRVASLAVGLQQLGAFLACFAIWPVTHRYGRKYAIIACSMIFIAGATIQTINTHSTNAFYLGRIIAGIGLGGSSVVVPMFSSEMTPKEIRGQVGSFYQLFFTFGIFTSYWIDYGVAKGIPKTESIQWQLPVGLQVVFAGLLGVGTLTLKESTRWLTQKGRYEDAYRSLVWIRASEDQAVQIEMDGIRAGVEREAHAKEGFKISEMFEGQNAKRTATAIAVFTAQQATGATAFAYFGPQYFRILVGNKDETNLLLTAIFGAVKVAACLIFVVFIADNVDRKSILTGGALFMAACQLSTAAVVKTHPVDPDAGATAAGIATVGLIYLFVIAYNFSWGCLPWPYVSEIFPARTREAGVAIGVATQWAGNFVFSFSTPYMIRNLGWATFLLWGLFDLVIAAFSWTGLTETKGKSLEEIVDSDGRSGSRDGRTRRMN